MILNIYKISNFDSNIFKQSCNEIEIIDENENHIECIIKLEKFSNKIFIDFKSKLLFIISHNKSQRRKIIKYLNRILQAKLTYFVPNANKEHDFLCSNEVEYLKFIHDNKIVDNEKLTKKYCKMELSNNYYFFEAKIKLKNNPNCYFLYYGDVIKVKDKFSSYLNEIIEFFVKFWGME